jgi:DNA-binding NarL/FixJ family response regulator
MKGHRSRSIELVEKEYGDLLRELDEILGQIAVAEERVTELRNERSKIVARLYEAGATRTEIAQCLGIQNTTPWLTVR